MFSGAENIQQVELLFKKGIYKVDYKNTVSIDQLMTSKVLSLATRFLNRAIFLFLLKHRRESEMLLILLKSSCDLDHYLPL